MQDSLFECHHGFLLENFLASIDFDIVTLAAMIIATANSKGGVGKTTVAVHLAGWLQLHGLQVTLVDCDPQQQAARWIRQAVPEITAECHINALYIMERLPELSRSNQVVVADGSAKLDEVSKALLLVADAVFVPCKAGGLEAWALDLATKKIREVKQMRDGMPQAVTLLTQVHDRYVLAGEMAEAADELGFPVIEQKLSLSQVYAQAPTDGKLLWQMGSRAKKYALEMDGVFCETLPSLLGEGGVSEVQQIYRRAKRRKRKHAA